MGQKDIAEKRLEAYNDVFHLSEARAKAYLKENPTEKESRPD